MLKHYIQYTYRGSFFSETGDEIEVKDRGGAKAILIMPFPEFVPMEEGDIVL